MARLVPIAFIEDRVLGDQSFQRAHQFEIFEISGY